MALHQRRYALQPLDLPCRRVRRSALDDQAFHGKAGSAVPATVRVAPSQHLLHRTPVGAAAVEVVPQHFRAFRFKGGHGRGALIYAERGGDVGGSLFDGGLLQGGPMPSQQAHVAPVAGAQPPQRGTVCGLQAPSDALQVEREDALVIPGPELLHLPIEGLVGFPDLFNSSALRRRGDQPAGPGTWRRYCHVQLFGQGGDAGQRGRRLRFEAFRKRGGQSERLLRGVAAGCQQTFQFGKRAHLP